MTSEMEIARAHDLIVGVLLGEVPVRLSEESAKYAAAACDALCWVLEHNECSQEFAENLQKIEAAAAARGFLLMRREGQHGK